MTIFYISEIKKTVIGRIRTNHLLTPTILFSSLDPTFGSNMLDQQPKEIFIEQDSNPVFFVDFDVLFTVKCTVIINVIQAL